MFAADKITFRVLGSQCIVQKAMPMTPAIGASNGVQSNVRFIGSEFRLLRIGEVSAEG